MLLKRTSNLQGSYNDKSGRQDRRIVQFTAKSMAQLIATVNATKIEFSSMVTLTYPNLFPKDGEVVKEDLHRFLTWFKRRYETEYLWFLEFQTRGAPHYHILTQQVNIMPKMRIELAENWLYSLSRANWLVDEAARESVNNKCKCEYKIIADNLSKAFKFCLRKESWEILRDKDGAKKYTTKYAAKEYQKVRPAYYKNVGRYWGCSKAVKLQGGVVIDKTEDEVREFLEQTGHHCKDWEVLPKYLFNVQDI